VAQLPWPRSAVDEVLYDETELIAEQTRFLLHELRALFSQEGLISHEDTVVVAARHAYPEYLRAAACVCQPGRAFRERMTYMGFYFDGAIQSEIARIRVRRDNVVLEAGVAETLSASSDPEDRAIGGATFAAARRWRPG
jgi:hypothetical protein